MTYYEVLGISCDAKESEIRKAYRKLAQEWHPDKFNTDEESVIKDAENKMKQLNEAYDVLNDEIKRRDYDATLDPMQGDIYAHYAERPKPSVDKSKRKYTYKKDSADLENEKKRQAVINFINIETQHRNDVMDMFAELMAGALRGDFSEHEYAEMTELVKDEATACVLNLLEIIKSAEYKGVLCLDDELKDAQAMADSLEKKIDTFPTNLADAKYQEETRISTERIEEIIGGLPEKIKQIQSFDLLSKTWEFENDTQLNAVRSAHIKLVQDTLSEIDWTLKTAKERDIPHGEVIIDSDGWRTEKTLGECRDIVANHDNILGLNLADLQRKFWDEKCSIHGRDGEIFFKFDGYPSDAEKCHGHFKLPPEITSFSVGYGEKSEPFSKWLGVHTITMPVKLIKNQTELPCYGKNFNKLVLDFHGKKQTLNIKGFRDPTLSPVNGGAVCLHGDWDVLPFVVVTKDKIFTYDTKRMCELNKVKNEKELEKIASYGYGHGATETRALIHLWAQAIDRVYPLEFMNMFPKDIGAIQKWGALPKPNLERLQIGLENQENLRLMRLYIALGALGDRNDHARAEYVFSQMNTNKLLKTRSEYVKQTGAVEKCPETLIDFIVKHIHNKDFQPYLSVLVDGYQLFASEAKKKGVELTPEFVMRTTPQYLLHAKVSDQSYEFAQKLICDDSFPSIADKEKIIKLRTAHERRAAKGETKNIVVTQDELFMPIDRLMPEEKALRYRYLDLASYDTTSSFYRDFINMGKGKRYRDSEAKSVLLSPDSNALEIVNAQGERKGIVMLHMFGDELFVDIASVSRPSNEKQGLDSDTFFETVYRAINDQKKTNEKIKSISIGHNETPYNSRIDKACRKMITESKPQWIKELSWDKFEYRFDNRPYSNNGRNYFARVMVEGQQQRLDSPSFRLNKGARDWRRDHRGGRHRGGWF